MSESLKLSSVFGLNAVSADESKIHSNVLHYGPYDLVYAVPTIPIALNFLCIGIAFLGAYMAICFCEQYRLSKMGDGKQKSKLLSNRAVFFFMALSFGGVTCWAMTFISLTGLELLAPIIKSPVDINFLVWPTVMALVIACTCTFTGLSIAARDPMFAKTKQEIVEQFVAHSSKLSFKEIQKITNMKMLFIISTQSMWNIIIGGLIDGSSTVICVCLSFYSIKIIYTNVVYNIGVICGVTVLSWFVSILAYWILFRLLSLYPHMEWLRLASASLMAFNAFIVGLILYNSLVFHIIGKRQASPTAFSHTRFMSQQEGYNGVVITAICFCFALVLVTFSDLRMWLYAKSAKLSSLEEIIESLKKESPHNADMIAAYMKRHAKVHSLNSHANQNSSHHSGNETSAANGSASNKSAKVRGWLATCCGWNSVTPGGDDSQYESCAEGQGSAPGSPRGGDANSTRFPSSPKRNAPVDSLRFVAPSHVSDTNVQSSAAFNRSENLSAGGNNDGAEEVRGTCLV